MQTGHLGNCPYVSAQRLCTDTRQQQEENYALEEYGQGSRCFEMDPNTNFKGQDGKNWKWKISTTTKIYNAIRTSTKLSNNTAACYKYKCDNGNIQIVVYDQSFECEQDGMRIDVNVTKDGTIHTGEISPLCPLLYCPK